MSSRFDAPSGWRCPFARVLELALALASTACMTPAALAAEGAAAEADTIPEVVVTATRREEKLKDVPVSVSVLSGDALQVLGERAMTSNSSPSRCRASTSNRRTAAPSRGSTSAATATPTITISPRSRWSLLYDDIIQENPALKGFPIFDQGRRRGAARTAGHAVRPKLAGRRRQARIRQAASSGRPRIFLVCRTAPTTPAVFQGVVNLPVSDQMAFRASVQGQHRDNWVNDPINGPLSAASTTGPPRLQLLFQPSDSFTALFNVHGRSLTGSSTLFRANIISSGQQRSHPRLRSGDDVHRWPEQLQLSTIGANVHLTWSCRA